MRNTPVSFPDGTLSNLWEYCHKSYHGGWCYVNPKYQRIIVGHGKVYDVNSLYPSMMHSKSGNRYPYGQGDYHTGKPPEKFWEDKNRFYFVRFRCRFHVKHSAFPWIHIRHSALYKSNENLYTSDVRYKGKYYRYVRNIDGTVSDTVVELTMTWSDYLLFIETYDIENFEWIDYVVFWAKVGLFDDYIDHYFSQKKTAKGFKRELAKLFLNNLYGKLASSDNSSYKEPFLAEDGILHFQPHEAHDKAVGYIPAGSAVTSYALNFTVRHAIANHDRFCYADTDSIHIVGDEPAEMVIEDPVELCCWKNESDFDRAYYVRQKTYAEHITVNDGNPVEPYLDIKASGMTKGAKDAFTEAGLPINALDEGLELEESNLKAERVPGGIVLREKTFKIRKQFDKKVTPVL